MNYELAKELKDAGFPQPEIFEWYSGAWGNEQSMRRGGKSDGDIYFPTLSELIEAIPTFYRLTHINRVKRDYFWRATAVIPHPGFWPQPTATGATPEIAVVRLYLALNKKST